VSGTVTTGGTTTNSTGEVSYGRRLTELAAEKPDVVDITIIHRDGSERDLSWQELETRANQIARALQSHGVGKDDVVGLALPSSAEHVLVTLAIWKLGATLLPLRHDLPDWEMDRMLVMARPKVLVSDTHRAEGPVLTRADLDATSALDGSALPDAISECVNLVASSGSTGFPKLIVTPSRGVVADEPSTGTTKGPDRSVCLVTSPLYHVNGFAFAAPNALEGDRVYIMEKFDAEQAVEIIEKHQITFTVMVPTMLQRVARLPNLRKEQLASLQRVVYGGAREPDWVVDRWIELVDPERFVLTYGSSERLGLMMMTGAEWAEHRGATGRPVDSTLSIRDEAGNELPRGEVGDIYVKPDPERRIFEYIGIPTPDPTPDGFWTLGDIGWMDDEGYLYVTDRRKDMIVSGGANVFPAEVEAALSEHPDVLDQVVVGVPDDEWGQRVHAIVQVTDPANPPSPDELRAWCKDRLASYKVPKTFEVVERVPRTDAGKLNRTDLGSERAGS
jgi:bile acid-coenzyme A ligase